MEDRKPRVQSVGACDLPSSALVTRDHLDQIESARILRRVVVSSRRRACEAVAVGAFMLAVRHSTSHVQSTAVSLHRRGRSSQLAAHLDRVPKTARLPVQPRTSTVVPSVSTNTAPSVAVANAWDPIVR